MVIYGFYSVDCGKIVPWIVDSSRNITYALLFIR